MALSEPYVSDLTDTFLGIDAMTAPNFYVGLTDYTVELTSEPGYARVPITFGPAGVGISSVNRAAQNETVTFTATGNWGEHEALFICLYDSPTGGNIIHEGDSTFGTIPGGLLSGRSIQFSPGEIELMLRNDLGGTFNPAYLDDLLNHLTGYSTFTPPSAFYFALFAGDPLTVGTEKSGSGYARVPLTFTVPATDGRASPNEGATFSNTGTSWTGITHGALMDASSGGNVLFNWPLNTTYAVTNGNSIGFLGLSVGFN